MSPVQPVLIVMLCGLLIALAGCVQEIARPGGTAAIGPTETPLLPTVTPTPEDTPAPSSSPSPVNSHNPGAEGTPSGQTVSNDEPTATPTREPSPVPTPTATATPVLTPTPTPEFRLDIESPQDGATVEDEVVWVYGFTRAGASVSIDGEDAEVEEDGSFLGMVTLEPGENTIEIVAGDEGGTERTETLRVTSAVVPQQPFFLVVIEPAHQAVVSSSFVQVTGITNPDAVVSVKDVFVPVRREGNLGIFETRVRLEPGLNPIDVIATSSDGDERSVPLRIIYQP